MPPYRVIFLIIFSLYIHNLNAWAQSPALQQADDRKAIDPVVEMEPYIVRADRILPEPESWRYIKIPALALDRESGGKKQTVVFPGYEILYAGRERDAGVLVRELQMRQVVSNFLFPMLVRMLPEQETMFVYNSHYRYLHNTRYNPKTDNIWTSNLYREVRDALLQDYKKPGAGEIIAGNILGRRVIYGTGERYSRIAGNEGAPGEAKWAWLIIMRDTLEWNKFSKSSKYPYWFKTGLEKLLSLMRFNANGVSFGDIMNEDQLVNKVRDRARASAGKRLPKLADMLQHEHVRSGEGGAGSVYYFIHYALFGDKGAHREKLATLVELMGAKPFSEELFQKAWGKSSKQVDADLDNYVRRHDMKRIVYQFQMPEMPPVVSRKATQSEIARLKAWLYLSRVQAPRALDELRIAYLRGERDPAMLAMLASFEQRIGSEERARKILKALMALPAPPPHTYIVAVRLRLNDLLAAKPKDAKLNAAESTELIATLSGALAGGLTNGELCNTLAEIVLKSAEPPDANTTGFLSEAAKRYPFNKTIADALKFADM
jgi:hypothetical protein